MRKIIFLICFTSFLSCSNVNSKEYKLDREEFIISYNSLDFYNYESKRNEVELPITYKYLEKLKKNSISEEKFFFDLLDFRLLLIQGSYEKCLNKLLSIKEINPLMYYFYVGIVNDFSLNKSEAIDYYRESIKHSFEYPDFKLFLEFLIDEDFEKYLLGLKSINDNIRYDIYSKYREKYKGISGIREQLIVEEVFNNYIVPSV